MLARLIHVSKRPCDVVVPFHGFVTLIHLALDMTYETVRDVCSSYVLSVWKGNSNVE